MLYLFHGTAGTIPKHNCSLSSSQTKPTDSSLYRLIQAHFDHCEQVYEKRFGRDYGFYRLVISDVVRAYLKCGDLKEGFARVRGNSGDTLLNFSELSKVSPEFIPRIHEIFAEHHGGMAEIWDSLSGGTIRSRISTRSSSENRKFVEHLNLWDNSQNQLSPPVRAGPKVSK